jgi:hypothetical protein
MPEMFQLPKFSVVVWVRKTDDYPTIYDRLLDSAVEEPCQSTEYEGMVDFHWGFHERTRADDLAGALREIADGVKSLYCTSSAVLTPVPRRH